MAKKVADLTNSKDLKLRFHNQLLCSTIHGVQNIARTSSKLVQLTWLLSILIASASSAYFMSITLNSYLNYDIVTQYNTFYEHASQFPTISICSTKQSFEKISILKCIFNQNDCMNYFQFYNDQYYKKCLRFNSGFNLSNKSIDILTTTVGGYKYGLIIDLNITTNLDFNELVVYIHNYTFKPVNLRNKGLLITTGKINHFQIEKIFDEKLDSPYNDCLKDIETFNLNKTIIDYISSMNNSYSQVECIRICRNLINMEKSGCNCVKAIDLPIDCDLNNQNQTVKLCYENFLREFQKKNVFEQCSSYCPLECDSISYSVSMLNSQQLPVSGLINKTSFEYEHFKFYDQVQKYFVSIRVYYSNELKYIYIKQTPLIDLANLVSQLGGTLGLFLGASFLSFIELIELSIEFLLYLLKK